MLREEQSFHPEPPPPVRPPEARVEQRLSEQSVRAIVDNYADVSRQNHERPWGEFSKDKGIIEGRRSALGSILDKLGQSSVMEIVDRQVFSQVFNGEPADPVVLAPITQPDWNMEQSLLADYQHQYMLRLLSGESRPRIGIIDRITGRAQELNAYFDYASGLNAGKLMEMKGFLQTIGCGIQMDDLQQEADRLLRRDPQGMYSQVEEQLAGRAEESRDKLREEGQQLEEGVREFDVTVAEESHKHPPQ